jgi:hypothetical protein
VIEQFGHQVIDRREPSGLGYDLGYALDVTPCYEIAGAVVDERARGFRGGLEVELKAHRARSQGKRLVLARDAAGESVGAVRQIERLAVPVKDVDGRRQ